MIGKKPTVYPYIPNSVSRVKDQMLKEVVALFAFLSSDEAAFITGHYFVIDGGEIAGGLASR